MREQSQDALAVAAFSAADRIALESTLVESVKAEGSTVFIASTFALLVNAATAATEHRSQFRIRDSFVVPDPATRTYYIHIRCCPRRSMAAG